MPAFSTASPSRCLWMGRGKIKWHNSVRDHDTIWTGSSAGAEGRLGAPVDPRGRSAQGKLLPEGAHVALALLLQVARLLGTQSRHLVQDGRVERRPARLGLCDGIQLVRLLLRLGEAGAPGLRQALLVGIQVALELAQRRARLRLLLDGRRLSHEVVRQRGSPAGGAGGSGAFAPTAENKTAAWMPEGGSWSRPRGAAVRVDQEHPISRARSI
jgi:hypothetical protein